jgi:hypothetical protein
MHIFDFALMSIVVVACGAIVYYRMRGASSTGRSLSRGLSRLFVAFVILCAVVLLVARIFFGMLPSWVFHLLLAGGMSVLAIATYLDYRHKRTI